MTPSSSKDLDTWATRDLPILRAIVQLVEERDLTRAEEIAERTGFDRETVNLGVRALRSEDPPFFTASASMGGGFGSIHNVTGHARRTVGQWPSAEGLADRITEALAVAAERTDDEEQKGLLRRTARYFGSAGRDLLVDVTGAVIARQVGA